MVQFQIKKSQGGAERLQCHDDVEFLPKYITLQRYLHVDCLHIRANVIYHALRNCFLNGLNSKSKESKGLRLSDIASRCFQNLLKIQWSLPCFNPSWPLSNSTPSPSRRDSLKAPCWQQMNWWFDRRTDWRPSRTRHRKRSTESTKSTESTGLSPPGKCNIPCCVSFCPSRSWTVHADVKFTLPSPPILVDNWKSG